MTDRQAIASQVRSVVGDVVDPELRCRLGELGMVRHVEVRGRGRVRIDIALTTPNCPMSEEIRRDVAAAADGVAGVKRCEVRLSTMSPDERDRAARYAIDVRRTSDPREIYAIASGKGGVGKSSIAANLAVALARRGRRVGLIDADVWGYSVPQLFGVRRAPVAMNGRMLPVHAHGVALMSLGFFVSPDEPIMWRGPMLHKALTQFVTDTFWGDLDVLILDLPPGTGDVTLSVLEFLPDAALVAVTTPQPAARSVASRVGALAQQVGMPVAGVIENMSELVCPHCAQPSTLFGAGGGEQLAAEIGCEVIGKIPVDVALRESGDRGVPVVVACPESASALALCTAAARLRPARRPLVGRSLDLTPRA
ncbi:Mrp/NBP35 family ATP-binding protein [Mycobacterium sp. THU-M104]|uniref:Mrp/NBP35 family ATP-binding protein n=1 Tax=Mycobacterium sp. THU-M104 TaxID=3410515 RepID=UPI003B9CA4F7